MFIKILVGYLIPIYLIVLSRECESWLLAIDRVGKQEFLIIIKLCNWAGAVHAVI